MMQKNPNLPNKAEVAHEVGTGAVVFHDLMNERLGDFDFKLEEVVRLKVILVHMYNIQMPCAINFA